MCRANCAAHSQPEWLEPMALPPPSSGPADLHGSLQFLSGNPAPIAPDQRADPGDLLPQPLADKLMGLDGVDGAWIERDDSGQRVVVLHYSPPGRPTHLPRTVQGMKVKIVGGEPIRALP